MLFRLIYNLGVLFRNRLIPQEFRRLKASETLSLEELQDHQYSKLKTLLEKSYETSAYYRDLFDREKILVGEIRSLKDISQIPILDKNTLLKNADKIQVPLQGGFKSETSGSTGTPLIFYRDKRWDAAHRAAILRGYSWHGIKPWERNGYFWGFNYKWNRRGVTLVADFLQNRFRCFSYSKSELSAFVNKLKKAKYLEGYSSMIYEAAKFVNQSNISFPNHSLKMIKGTSEKIHDFYQSEVQKAFGRKMISEYGAAEVGIIAFECEFGKMHITEENVLVECIENEIVVTNLYSSSFPIIRYKLGDYIKLEEQKCACGRSHRIISEVTGRVGNVIHGKQRKYPSLTLYYVSKNLILTRNLEVNYQAIQKKKGELVFRVFGTVTDASRDAINSEFRKYFSDDLSVEIIEERSAQRSKKLKDFVSEL